MSRRRASFDWMTAPDEGDAAAVCREITAWLEAARRRPDPDAVLGSMRGALARLVEAPVLKGDPGCRAILLGLASAVDMAEIDDAMAALARRVDEAIGVGPPRPERHILGL